MSDVERFEIRDLDPEHIRSERQRVVRELRQLVPFATVIEVGSTAVEGIVGKQDIDFLVRVPEAQFTEARELLDQTFARDPHQLSDHDFQGYRVPSPLDVAVQLAVQDGRYDVFERFLDRLRSNPELRRAYNELKMALNSKPMEEYREAKDAFIEKAIEEAERN